MSQYVSFYMKPKSGKQDEWILLGDFCGGSSVYRAANPYLPYGEGACLNAELLRDIKQDIKEDIGRYRAMLYDEDHKQELICKMQNVSIQDRLEEIAESETAKAEIQEEIDGCESALGWYSTLLDIVEATEFCEDDFNATAIWGGVEWGPSSLYE